MHPWIELDQEPATVLVTPVGELDMIGAGSLRTALAEAAGWGLPVVVDLSRVPGLGPPALAVLVGGRNRLREHGSHLTLVNPAPDVRRLFHTTGLDRVLTVQRQPRAHPAPNGPGGARRARPRPSGGDGLAEDGLVRP